MFSWKICHLIFQHINTFLPCRENACSSVTCRNYSFQCIVLEAMLILPLAVASDPSWNTCSVFSLFFKIFPRLHYKLTLIPEHNFWCCYFFLIHDILFNIDTMLLTYLILPIWYIWYWGFWCHKCLADTQQIWYFKPWYRAVNMIATCSQLLN